MTSRRALVPAISSISLLGAAVATVPAAQAVTTTVTAQTAGTKVIGQTTYIWGSSNAPAGTKVCSQVNLSGKWSTSQCSTVRADHGYSIELTYNKSVLGTYTFRAVAGSAVSAPVKLTRVRSAVTNGTAPTKPAPTTGTYQGGTLASGYTLYSGYNGVKVYIAQKHFGMATSPMSSTMNTPMINKIASFQRSKRLTANGVLDEKTWNAMNTGYPFAIDSWAKTADVMDNAPRDVKVAAMISFAKAQLGKPYIWGGTGPMGFDCSGLLLQAARAGGMKPTGVSNFTDVRPASDLSNQMWKDAEFQKGSLSKLQLGDFVYYAYANGVVHHVSMYVGNNTVINAVGSRVQYSSLSENFQMRKIGVNRAIRL